MSEKVFDYPFMHHSTLLGKVGLVLGFAEKKDTELPSEEHLITFEWFGAYFTADSGHK